MARGVGTNHNKPVLSHLLVPVKVTRYYITRLVKYETACKGIMQLFNGRQDAGLDPLRIVQGVGDIPVFDLNLFFLLKNGTLVTPSLEDTILPGITRLSVLQIAKDKGIKTEERRISVDEVFAEAKEVFASGTAAGVTFFESITHKGKEVVFGDGKIGEFSAHALKTLKGIQYGLIEDKYGWMVPV